MSIEVLEFKKKLSKHLQFNVELIVNENRSTMLNILTRKRDYAKVSMHKMFLRAPEEVISAIAHYVRGSKKRDSREENLRIRSFIQTNLERLNYSKALDRSKFITEGNIYDLQKIYDEINARYFENKLNLAITWYGERGRKNRSRVTFGQYFDHLRLVKIHRILDDIFFPPFFVEYVVYHEMLHHVVQGYVDENGLFRTHGSEFKEKEKLFHHYERASDWERRHRDDFFKPNLRTLKKVLKYGRT